MAFTFSNDGNSISIQGDWWAMKVSDERVTGDQQISHRRREAGERRRSGSEPATTPLSEWKFYDGDLAEGSREHQGVGGGVGATVSARKLAAALWKLAATTNCSGDVRWHCGLSDGLGFEFCSAPAISKSSMEGVTKWDYGYPNASGDVNHFHRHARLPKYQEKATISVASARQAGSFKDKKCVNERNAEEGLSTTEQKQICQTAKDLRDDVGKARKNCKMMYILYSKLLSDIAEAKSSAMKFMHKCEKEKKAREFLEDVCIEQAKELEANKAEIRELRIQCAGIQQEVAEERKMLQMAEAWREERAQMKLVDAKLILEDKYSQMNNLIADLKAFLRSSKFPKDVNEMSNAKILEQALGPCNIQGIQEILYMLPKSDNEFTNINAEAYDSITKNVQSNILIGSGCVSEDTSGKETMSQADNVADHEYQKAESCEISSVSSKQ